MTEQTLLFRQVTRDWVMQGRITSQTFKPFPKDDGQVSVYDGDIIETAEASFEHYTQEQQLESVGVVAVTKLECDGQGLPAETDGQPYDAHAYIDFRGVESNKQIEKKARKLKDHAIDRDWLYRASDGTE